jgi:hypothetical protein
MTEQFPKRRPDGTFTVRVHFTGDVIPRAAEIERWLHQWVSVNGTWDRLWEGKAPRQEQLQFLDTFLRPPYLLANDERGFDVGLDSGTSAVWWKDWMARLVKDASSEFRVSFSGIDSV